MRNINPATDAANMNAAEFALHAGVKLRVFESTLRGKTHGLVMRFVKAD